MKNLEWIRNLVESERRMEETGIIDLSGIQNDSGDPLRGKLGLPVERDLSFEGKYPISIYAKAANIRQQITTDKTLVEQLFIVPK